MAAKAGPKKAGTGKTARAKAPAAPSITGACLCGGVEIAVDVPVFWAWHDHSAASRRAHGAVYATYAGCWKSKVRVTKGEKLVSVFSDAARGHTRSFCSRCGSPLMFARKGSPKWLNVPRALFTGRTGREAKYHIAIEELQDWAYLGAPVGPLKGYPGVTVEKTRKPPRAKAGDSLFEP